MQFKIVPQKSAGPIKLGKHRHEVRQEANSPVEEFMKTPTSRAATDAFDELGIHVYYDEKDRATAVELWDDSNASLDGISIFSMTPKESVSWLRQLDSKIETDEVSAISRRLGISLYAAEGLDSNEGRLDSVVVFLEGYYD